MVTPTRHKLWFWPLVVALIVYAALISDLYFTQDDAYISYRYVANYLNGDGLVYNIGERIEGITNFGWTIFMIFLGILGADFAWWSNVVGALFGAGVIVLTFLIGERLFGREGWVYTAVATLLLGANQSLAYWSVSGLETGAFAFVALLSLLLYLRRSWLLIFALAMAVWLRPEGAVVTALLILAEVMQTRSWPRFTFACAALAFIVSLPFVGFKLWYYGSILPNPFYAKTSFDLEQLKNGLEYAGEYSQHYAVYYVGLAALIAPLLLWKQTSGKVKTLWFFTVGYFVYVILIGGDVLKVHRFFLPVFGPMALLMLLAIWTLLKRFRFATQYLILLPVAAGMLASTYFLPKDVVFHYNRNEKAFTHKMQFKARALKEADPSNFSVAVATIGIFGYELLGHDIIDLVGLTDSTIARYSEDPIPGMETTWKEQKHNTRYLLTRAPNYIMFSTGIKPSAPAERALLLYRQFTDSYRTVGWFYQHPDAPYGVISSVFKKVRPIEGDLVPYYPVEYVQEYKKALDVYSGGDHRTALKYYEAAIRASPRPYFIYLLHQMAFSLQMVGEVEKAHSMFQAIIARDSLVFESHLELYRWSALAGDTAGMTIHRTWLQRLVPWYWPRIDSTVQEQVRQARGR
jgi:arabinofuranosyltransferase